MNRHHYSLFVHGDKLVLLLRREAADASDMEVFKPAEWRWKISEINQRDEWHHYAISVNFPRVSTCIAYGMDFDPWGITNVISDNEI